VNINFQNGGYSRFVEVSDKEISEIKMNSDQKNTKKLAKILKQLFASGSVIIGEYSPRLLPRTQAL
jgi:hypothetical protein